MRRLSIFLLISIPLFFCATANGDGNLSTETFFVELNCENLFDCEHDSLKEDYDFLPDGRYVWQPSYYWGKLNNIARTIISCGELPEGRFVVPSLVALCEVENDSVLHHLTSHSLLHKAGYEFIATNSPDVRGIDVALLYIPHDFTLLSHHSIRVKPIKEMRPTRDILYAKGKIFDDILHVFVVHAPSRTGGEYETHNFRAHVNNILQQAVDSVFTADGTDARILVAGDFNDYDVEEYHPNLIDVSENAQGLNGAKGTYKFEGLWGNLDHILVSKSLKQSVHSCRVGDQPFLLTKDEQYGGVQPLRGISNGKWSNGYSDHLPLVLNLHTP